MGGRHEIEYQVWTGSSFEKLRTVDTTASMTGGGTVGLFMSDPAARGVFFGREGYWLRVLDVARRFTENPVSPCLRAILPNAVRVVQTRREPEEVFPSDIYEAERRVFLNARARPLLRSVDQRVFGHLCGRAVGAAGGVPGQGAGAV